MNRRSLKTLDNAYHGALAIKAIEDKHFEGKKIVPDSERGKSVFDYFQSTLNRELLKIRLNLTQFRAGNFFFPADKKSEISDPQEAEILEKLGFIEAVIGKYRTSPKDFEMPKTVSPPTAPSPQPAATSSPEQSNLNPSDILGTAAGARSFFELRRELTPEYEQQVIQQLRSLRQERKIALRFLILLIIVPLAVQVFMKNVVYSPLINWKFVDTVKLERIKISEELGEKYLEEFTKVKEVQEIKSLLGIIPELSEEQKHEFLQEKAQEMAKESAYKTLEGWKNLLADLTSLGVFAGMVYLYRR
jgi:hypothetical protein